MHLHEFEILLCFLQLFLYVVSHQLHFVKTKKEIKFNIEYCAKIMMNIFFIQRDFQIKKTRFQNKNIYEISKFLNFTSAVILFNFFNKMLA